MHIRRQAAPDAEHVSSAESSLGAYIRKNARVPVRAVKAAARHACALLPRLLRRASLPSESRNYPSTLGRVFSEPLNLECPSDASWQRPRQWLAAARQTSVDECEVFPPTFPQDESWASISLSLSLWGNQLLIKVSLSRTGLGHTELTCVGFFLPVQGCFGK